MDTSILEEKTEKSEPERTEKSEPEKVFPSGHFGDDVLTMSADLKAPSLTFDQLKNLGDEDTAKPGKTAEQLDLENTTIRERAER